MKRAALCDEGPVSFLSRLGGRPAREPEPKERFRREVRAILRNLESIFNTKKGVGCVLPTYGLGDYEGKLLEDGTAEPLIGTKDTLSVLAPEIADQVRRFEPRIEDPVVAVLGRNGVTSVVLGIRGQVAGKKVDFRVELDVTYRSVKVEAEGTELD